MVDEEPRGEPPMLLEPNGPIVFPNPTIFDEHGLVAFGGDLAPERLLFAYQNAIFPWFDDASPPLWWSPDPRCVLPLERLHIPRRLARRLRRGDFRVTVDTAFEQVMRGCAMARSDGTWITEWMVRAYTALHAIGHASSIEVWQGKDLVGGLYGVRVGALFAGESMFKLRTDMSKVALVATVQVLRAAGCRLFDVQMKTAHLSRFGCIEIPRRDYVARLHDARDRAMRWPRSGAIALSV